MRKPAGQKSQRVCAVHAMPNSNCSARQGKVIQAIAKAVAEISTALRTPGVTETGSTNTFGDRQLEADVQTDRIVFEHLRASGAVETASSEESSDMHALGGSGFSVRAERPEVVSTSS